MRFHIPLHSKPALKVTDVGKPHLRVQLSDFWEYLLGVGLVDDGDPLYSLLKKALPAFGHYSIRFNPATWFGKFISHLSLYHFLPFTMYVMSYNLWARSLYFLQRRIRPHLLKPKLSKTPLFKTMSSRLKLRSQPTSIPPSNLLHFHKSSFQPLHITLSTPMMLRPVMILYFGLSLPRRHPREGVG